VIVFRIKLLVIAGLAPVISFQEDSEFFSSGWPGMSRP
jgi:hypothetical protein